YAAPLYESDTPTGAVIGVVMFKAGFESVDEMLRRFEHPTVLLSPQGVAFASTRPEWLYAVAPPLTQARIDAVRATRQFGNLFENGGASALPFSPDAREVLINGTTYAIAQRNIDWKDPGGPWQLVILDDISLLMPAAQRWLVGGVAFV